MSDKMSDKDFAAKVEWEGLYYAFLDYGLKSEDLADQDGDLAAAVRKFEAMLPRLREVVEELEGVLEAVGSDD
jgi:hypothetical protein